jgi:hypothetical protein
VSAPLLYKYIDLGPRAFADITLTSGERVFVSLSPKGFTVHRLILGGFIPGRRLFAVNVEDRDRMVRVLMREEAQLPVLPQATKEHRDEGALMEFMDAAIIDLTAVGEGKAVPGAVDAIETENPPPRPMSLLTRLALACASAAELSSRFERTRNIPG